MSDSLSRKLRVQYSGSHVETTEEIERSKKIFHSLTTMRSFSMDHSHDDDKWEASVGNLKWKSPSVILSSFLS